MEEISVIQGSISDVKKIRIKDLTNLDSNWGADLIVQKYIGIEEETLIKRELLKSDNLSHFILQLSPLETNFLSPGRYFLTVRIDNPNNVPTPFRKEIQYKLIIEQSASGKNDLPLFELINLENTNGFITKVFKVESELGMINLEAKEGDLVIRKDIGRSFVHNGFSSVKSKENWTLLGITSITEETQISLDGGYF